MAIASHLWGNEFIENFREDTKDGVRRWSANKFFLLLLFHM